jgi:hypothetical protein
MKIVRQMFGGVDLLPGRNIINSAGGKMKDHLPENKVSTSRAAASNAGAKAVSFEAPAQLMQINHPERKVTFDTDDSATFKKQMDVLFSESDFRTLEFVIGQIRNYGSSENDRIALEYAQNLQRILLEDLEERRPLKEEFIDVEKDIDYEEYVDEEKDKKPKTTEGETRKRKNRTESHEKILESSDKKETKRIELMVADTMPASDAITIIEDWIKNKTESKYILTAQRKAALIEIILKEEATAKAKNAIIGVLRQSLKGEVAVIYEIVDRKKVHTFLDKPVGTRTNNASGRLDKIEEQQKNGEITRVNRAPKTPKEMARLIVEILQTDDKGRKALQNLQTKKLVIIFDKLTSVYLTFDGVKFVRKEDVASKGLEDPSQPEKTWYKKGQSMESLVSTVVHEYIHSIEKEGLSEHESETDAHYGEQEWRLKMGLAPDKKYLTAGKVDKEKISKDQQSQTLTEEQEKTTREFIGLSEDGKRVKLKGGSDFVDPQKGDHGEFTEYEPAEDSEELQRRSKEFLETIAELLKELDSPLMLKK